MFLKDNPRIALDLEDKIRAAHGLDFNMTDEEMKLLKDDDSVLEA